MSFLINSFVFSVAGGPTLWTPSELSSLYRWYKIDAVNGVDTTGGNLLIKDQTGFSLNAYTVGQSAAFNGTDTVTYNGAIESEGHLSEKSSFDVPDVGNNPVGTGFVNTGLCYDPAGDSDNGSFFVGNDGRNANNLNTPQECGVVELALDGTLLNNFPLYTQSPVSGYTDGQRSVQGVTIDTANGTLWATILEQNILLEINKNTGVLTGTSISLSHSANGLAYDPAGASGAGTFWTIDSAGTVREVNRSGINVTTFTSVGASPQDHLYLDTTNRVLYHTYGSNNSNADIEAIDVVSGSTQKVATLPTVPCIEGITFVNDVMYICDDGDAHGNNTNRIVSFDFRPDKKSTTVSIHWVGDVTANSGTDKLFGVGGDELNECGFGIFVTNSTTFRVFNNSSTGTSQRDFFDASGTSAYGKAVWGIEYNVIAGTFTVYRDGTAWGSGSGTSVSTNAFLYGQIFGNIAEGANRYSTFDLNEYVTTDAIETQADRERLEGYLAWEHGLEGNLPVAHPYKSAPPTIFNFLLDTYSGATAAYSIRKLSSTATNAIRIRRDSDNAEQDIGFVNGELDTTSLESFLKGHNNTLPLDTASATAAYSLRYVRTAYTGDVIRVRRDSDNAESDFNPTEITDGTMATWIGSNNGFVTTWYDQSGNSNNAVQATTANQPKIYDSSTGLITQNAKPAIDFAGSTQRLTMAVNVPATYFLSIVAANANYTAMFDGNGGSSTIRFSSSQVSLWPGYVANNLPTATNGIVVSNLVTLSQNPGVETDRLQTWANSTDLGQKFSTNLSPLTNGTINPGQIGYSNSFGGYTGNIQEIILYDSDQSSNRTAIEGNINKHYDIYAANGFVATWYDQSGNNYHATQATIARQPKIYDSITGLVLENGKPALNFSSSNFTAQHNMTSSTSEHTYFSVATSNDTGVDRNIVSGRSGGDRLTGHSATATDRIKINAGTEVTSADNIANTNQNVWTAKFAVNNGDVWINGTQYISGGGIGTETLGTFGVRIGSNKSETGSFWNGSIQELIIYNSDQSSNRTGIESNINTHYGIY